MKYNILIISFLVLIMSCTSAIADNNYIINDDTVYIDDSKVYLSATPHTLSSSGWVYFNLTSKVYTGNIDACWGFNTSVSKPTKAEVYSPYWVNTTSNHEKTFYNSTFHVYTGNDLDYGNSYNTNYKYTINESVINDNGTTYITSNAAFDSYTTDGINYTIYWYTRHDNHYLWEDFSSSFNSVIHDYKGYNKWYYIKNVPITSNKEYTVRAWIDVPVSTKKQSGKYYFAIKPSHETVAHAVSNGHFYNLDPWWDAAWSKRINITLLGNTSGTQTDYQLLLNVTYDNDMQSDFGDLRFCNETHKLDSWLESKVNNSYALVWVEFPTTPANGANQTYYMYYGNAGAASDWDMSATFTAFSDDFEDGSLTDWTDAMTTFEASTTVAKHGSYSLKTQSATWQYGYQSFNAINSPLACDFWVYPTSINTRQFGLASASVSDRTNSVYAHCHNDGYFASFDGSTTTNWGLNYNANQWYRVRLVVYPATDTFDAYIDNMVTPLQTGLSIWGTFDGTIQSFYLRNENSIQYYDTIFIHKYATNPPTYTLGSEEHYISEPTTLIEETGLIMSEITSGMKGINRSNYLVYAFVLIGILLIILSIQIIVNNTYRG